MGVLFSWDLAKCKILGEDWEYYFGGILTKGKIVGEEWKYYCRGI